VQNAGRGEYGSVANVSVLNSLASSYSQTSTPDDAKLLATSSLTPLLPLLILFLSDPHTATSLALHPFASQLLSFYKKQKRAAGAGQVKADPTMTVEKRAFLEELLKAAVGGMAYGGEVEWEMATVGEEDEDQLLFEELRKVSTPKNQGRQRN